VAGVEFHGDLTTHGDTTDHCLGYSQVVEKADEVVGKVSQVDDVAGRGTGSVTSQVGCDRSVAGRSEGFRLWMPQRPVERMPVDKQYWGAIGWSIVVVCQCDAVDFGSGHRAERLSCGVESSACPGRRRTDSNSQAPMGRWMRPNASRRLGYCQVGRICSRVDLLPPVVREGSGSPGPGPSGPCGDSGSQANGSVDPFAE